MGPMGGMGGPPPNGFPHDQYGGPPTGMRSRSRSFSPPTRARHHKRRRSPSRSACAFIRCCATALADFQYPPLVHGSKASGLCSNPRIESDVVLFEPIVLQ